VENFQDKFQNYHKSQASTNGIKIVAENSNMLSSNKKKENFKNYSNKSHLTIPKNSDFEVSFTSNILILLLF
jgi:hypothetical protein